MALCTEGSIATILGEGVHFSSVHFGYEFSKVYKQLFFLA